MDHMRFGITKAIWAGTLEASLSGNIHQKAFGHPKWWTKILWLRVKHWESNHWIGTSRETMIFHVVCINGGTPIAVWFIRANPCKSYWNGWWLGYPHLWRPPCVFFQFFGVSGFNCPLNRSIDPLRLGMNGLTHLTPLWVKKCRACKWKPACSA